MDSDHVLILAEQPKLSPITLNQAGQAAKQSALTNAALIGKVTDRDSKIIAVRSQQELKSVISLLEKSRVELKEPALIYGRAVDTFAAREKLDLEKEFGRVSNCVKEFDDAERRRVLEEERLQREELAKIEAAKQAELKRIADEQAAREAEARRIQAEAAQRVREAEQAAAALAAVATNKRQREAAERARKEAEEKAALASADKAKQDAILAEQAKAAADKSALVEEKAGDAAYCAAKPVEITKVAGQRQSTNWNIIVEQPFVLAKYHPDLVDIKPRLADIKAALNEGREIKGIKAEREYISGVRLPPERRAIEV